MPLFIQVVTTVNDRDAAHRIAGIVLEKRLAACVQIFPCRSMYRWQGEIEAADEFFCVMKSRIDLMQTLEQTVKKIHPYDVPEILATRIIHGSEDYLEWLNRELLPYREESSE